MPKILKVKEVEATSSSLFKRNSIEKPLNEALNELEKKQC